MITFAVLGRIVRHREVTGQTLFGAVAVYFLIGQIFAWVYVALPGYADGKVLEPDLADDIPMYYSYVVLTSLGFGDVLPDNSLAERVTVLEALFGQIFLATFVARLVAMHSRPSATDTESALT